MSDRMKRHEREIVKKRLLKCALLILILFLGTGLIYKTGQNISVWYGRKQLDTTVPIYGCLEDKLKGQGLVLRSEITVKAPTVGRFENAVAERDKVARSTLVGYYLNSGRKTALYAPTAGIYTRRVDGLEAALSDIKLASVGPEVFKYQPLLPPNTDEIKAGQGVFKIVNNLIPSLILAHFPVSDPDLTINKQQKVKLLVKDKSLGFFQVADYKRDNDEIFLLLESDDFLEELLDSRLLEVEMVYNSSDGYLVPQKSLVKRGQEKGIYCTKGENIIFKTVKVLDQKDDIAVIEGIEANDIIVVNPAAVKQKL
ncbi:Uncharacterized [Syntrophomonas zehnderi OL-4]|uniref:Uncharacterized n=2 Tax=Syntrophomonas TaxID=862 RepID=A0A0E4C8P5_9FIRM|nr:Uncharacterized [Syntrophomonas zehnderi OL-4]